jgi:hypothetical protein
LSAGGRWQVEQLGEKEKRKREEALTPGLTEFTLQRFVLLELTNIITTIPVRWWFDLRST